jgi:hypothetical protein
MPWRVKGRVSASSQKKRVKEPNFVGIDLDGRSKSRRFTWLKQSFAGLRFDTGAIGNISQCTHPAPFGVLASQLRKASFGVPALHSTSMTEGGCFLGKIQTMATTF